MKFPMKNFTTKRVPAFIFSILLLTNFTLKAATYEACMEIQDNERERARCYRMVTNMEIGNGEHCIDCNLPDLPEVNPWAEVAKVAIGGIAAVLPTYFSSKYAYKSADAWATSYENGITSCHGAIDSYNGQLLERGSNPVLADQQNAMLATCNGYGMNAYAGGLGLSAGMYGGVYNPMISYGYSPGFSAGMMGPNYGYGGNIYGNGGYYGGYYPGGVNGGVNIGSSGGNPWAIMAGGALASLLTGGSINGTIGVNGQIGNPYGIYGQQYPYGVNGQIGYPSVYSQYPYNGININGQFGIPGINGQIGIPGINGQIGYPNANIYTQYPYNNGININGQIGIPGINGQIGIPGINGQIGYPNPNIYTQYPSGVNINGQIGIPGINGQIGIPGVNVGVNGAACSCFTAPCHCGNNFPGGGGGVNGNWQYNYPNMGIGPNGGQGTWGLNTYPYSNGGVWGQNGGWQAQAQAQAFVNGVNNAQQYAAGARAQGNRQTDMYANQALYQNYVNAARDLNYGQRNSYYGGVYGNSFYNSGYNLNAIGNVGANFNIGINGSAGFNYSF